MELPRWDPFRVIEALSAQRLKDGAPAPGRGRLDDEEDRGAFQGPGVAVLETAAGFLITVDLPAVDDRDVRVDVVGGVVRVHLPKAADHAA